MNSKLAQAYAKLRAEGIAAPSAIRYARIARTETYAPGDTIEIEIAGIDCVATFTTQEDDDSPDLSWLGEIGDTYHHPYRGRIRQVTPERSEADHYKELRAMKYGRAQARTLARKYYLQDVRRLERYADGQWCFLGLIVTITDDDGTKLASSSVWGVESDASADYMADLYADQLTDAKDQAAAKIERMRAKYCACH